MAKSIYYFLSFFCGPGTVAIGNASIQPFGQFCVILTFKCVNVRTFNVPTFERPIQLIVFSFDSSLKHTCAPKHSNSIDQMKYKRKHCTDGRPICVNLSTYLPLSLILHCFYPPLLRFSSMHQRHMHQMKLGNETCTVAAPGKCRIMMTIGN